LADGRDMMHLRPSMVAHSSTRFPIIAAGMLAAAACGENGPDFSVRAVVTVFPIVAPYACAFRWEGFASDSTTRADVTLFELYSDGAPILVPLGPNVYQQTFHGYTDITWAGAQRRAPIEMTGLRWMIWKYGTVLVVDDTVPVQGWPTCSAP
jgi:hypothetical protein